MQGQKIIRCKLMCEVGLGSNQEAKEGVKAPVSWPELLPVGEEHDEAVNAEDEDGDYADRKCVNPCFIKQKPALLQTH